MRTRKAKLFFALLLCLFVLAGCGGHSGSGPTPTTQWQYTALGDSIGAGLIATTGYVPRYRSYVATDTSASVTLTNLSVSGWTSGNLLNALNNDSNFRAQISSAQVVTWDIGGNDLLDAIDRFNKGTCGGADNQDCMRSAVTTFNSNWDATVTKILSFRDKNSTIIRTMDIYNPFVATLKTNGTFATVNPYLTQINAHIASSAAANGIPVAQVHTAFNGAAGDEDPIAKGYIALDGVHPNDNGHKVIADAFRTLGYAPLK